MHNGQQQGDDVLADRVAVDARAVRHGEGAAVAAVHLVDVAVDARGDGVDVAHVLGRGDLGLVAVVHEHLGARQDLVGHLRVSGIGKEFKLRELLPQVGHGAGTQVAAHHADPLVHVKPPKSFFYSHNLKDFSTIESVSSTALRGRPPTGGAGTEIVFPGPGGRKSGSRRPPGPPAESRHGRDRQFPGFAARRSCIPSCTRRSRR